MVGWLVGSNVAAHAQTRFEGPEVADAVASSVNVTDAVLQVLQAQSRYDRELTFGGFTTRWAPGVFVLSDGQELAGNLARWQLGGGLGFGTPSEIGGSVGFAFDGVKETGAEALDYAVFQGIFDFGLGFRGFQVSLGGRLDLTGAGSAGLDWNDQFVISDTPDVYRAVLPQTYARGVQTTNWSVYHDPTGAFLTVSYGDGVVYELRGDVQPLARILPPLFGLPALGLRWLDDRIAAASHVTEAPVPGGFEALEPPRKRFQTNLGTDDALGIGLRVRVVGEWLPSPAFRYVEVGMVKSLGEIPSVPLGFGFRGAVGRPDGALVPAFESFVMLGAAPVEGHPEGGGHLALAYSYGVPDATTYLPIPQGHVFGVQVVVGPPETSKPIVPIVRGLDAER
jgi:hypothetical protein